MTIESGGNPQALSKSGAMGLMQVMPFHSCASWEPEANIACGVSILENYIARSNGNVREGLAAYNAGMTVGRGNLTDEKFIEICRDIVNCVGNHGSLIEVTLR